MRFSDQILTGFARKFSPKKLSLALARTFGAGIAVTLVSVAYAQTPPGMPLRGHLGRHLRCSSH
jgi:hypothetical protein